MEPIVKEITLEIAQPMVSPIHQDSFWYDGTIAKLTFQDRTIYVLRSGESRWRNSENGRIITASYQLTAEEFAKGDPLLFDELDDNGWIFNSWFTFDCFLGASPTMFKEYNGDVAFSYDEAIGAAKDIIIDDDWWEGEV